MSSGGAGHVVLERLNRRVRRAMAFGSRLPRFPAAKSGTPGPGSYDPNAEVGFEAWAKKHASSSFLSNRERFISEVLSFADGASG